MAIIGDGFESWVQTQIGVRQKALGDFNNRKLDDLKAFQSRTPWIRLASSVDIEDGDTDLPGTSVKTLLKNMGFDTSKISGDKLAKELVMFRGVSDSSGNTYSGAGGGIFGSSNAFTAGDEQRGPVPMPGVTGASFSYKNDGALAQAEINIKCFNRAQFQLLDVLYQRPGYTVLLEFGWSVYLKNDGDIEYRKNFSTKPFAKLFESGNDMFALSEAITTEKKSWNGNYDGFFGKITKFNWKFNSDGSYDITVNLIGLGDVIQSFKTNLAPSPEMTALAQEGNWDDEDRQKASQEGMIIAADAITTVLNAKLFNIFNSRYWANGKDYPGGETGAFQIRISDVPIPTRDDKGKITSWTKKTISHPKGGYQILNADTDAYKWYKPSTYITLNTLLALLAANCNMHNPKDDSPILCYDFDLENPMKDKNRMATFPGMYSGNPAKILFPYKPVPSSITTKVDMPNGVVNKELTAKGITFYANTDGTLAYLGNVYIDTNHLATLLKENKDEDDNILLLDFLNAVLASINLTSGGINEFRVIHDSASNLIRIISEKPLNEQQTAPCVINTYGVKTDQGSFVRSLDLSAELTDKFATMISVGAQADGNSAAGNATAFSIYNKGLIDRVTPEKAVLTTTSASADEPADPFEKIWTKEFTELFCECWGAESKKYGMFRVSGQGLDFTSETIGPLESAVQEWAQLCTGRLTQKKEYPAPFFLPFNLSLTMDGLGGMKIYNSFKVDDKVLPPTYDSNAIQLIIKSLSHEISETDWTTKVETFAKPIFGAIKKPTVSLFKNFNISSNKKSKSYTGGKPADGTWPVEGKTITSGYPIGNIYIKKETQKNLIILHHTAGHSKGPQSTITGWSKRAYSYLVKSGSHNRVATHYVISQQGSAEQVFDDKYWAGNAGVRPSEKYLYLSKNSLAIEIQAVGGLYDYNSKSGKWRSKAMDGGRWPIKWGGEAAQPVDNNYNPITFRGYTHYQKYSDACIEETRKVVKGWMSKHNIPFEYDYKRLFPNEGEPLFLPPKGWKGVVTHTTIKSTKTDIFPQKEMLQMLKSIANK